MIDKSSSDRKRSVLFFRLPKSKQSKAIGASVLGRKIMLYRHGAGRCPVLLIGGVHGDESEGYLLAERFLKELQQGRICTSEKLSLYVCPRLNPDGCRQNRRTNHRNVDLNRNLPSADWKRDFENPRYYPGPAPKSEPESKAALRLLQSIRPALILSLHSYEKAMINYNGPCAELAMYMSSKNGLPPNGDIGYPTPGSLGTYAGWERAISTITLEILSGQKEQEVWHMHHEALRLACEYYTSS